MAAVRRSPPPRAKIPADKGVRAGGHGGCAAFLLSHHVSEQRSQLPVSAPVAILETRQTPTNVVVMGKLAKIHGGRTEKRRLLALDRARRVLDGAANEGIRISLIGSLAGSDFQLHSDVDFFVHGDTDPDKRVLVERLVASNFRGTDLPYDIVYASDLTLDRVREFTGG